LVTGGTRGIGAAICHRLAADGAVVAAGFSSNRERADELRQAIETDGTKKMKKKIKTKNSKIFKKDLI